MELYEEMEKKYVKSEKAATTTSSDEEGRPKVREQDVKCNRKSRLCCFSAVQYMKRLCGLWTCSTSRTALGLISNSVEVRAF